MDFIKKISLGITALILMLGFVAPLGTAYAQTPKDEACKGLELTGGDCSGTADTDVNSIIKTVINIFSFIVGVAAVIMIMIGGLRYITSGGDAASTKAAKDTILYALIGMAVAVLAQVIVRFVLGRI